ncbi:unnamed protein product [Agarophyton chilense]
MDEEGRRLYRAIGFDPAQEDVSSLSQREIASAYRKAALKWHPDRNRHDSKAAHKFSEIFLAYETLSAPDTRKKYDDAIRAARKKQERLKRMDSARSQFREALERDEKAGWSGNKNSSPFTEDALNRVQKEIERLRQEATEATHHSGQQLDRKNNGSPVLDVGPWAEVPGYSEFRDSGVSSFDDFENSILNRKIPF